MMMATLTQTFGMAAAKKKKEQPLRPSVRVSDFIHDGKKEKKN